MSVVLLNDIGREARADPQRRKMARIRESRKEARS